jgi:cyclic di-GMP phosphodiesterase
MMDEMSRISQANTPRTLSSGRVSTGTAAGAAANARAEVSDASSRRPAQILVVDDDARNRKLAEAMLKAEGYRVVTAPSGAEALAIMSRDKPDLILLDVMMPEMTGFELAGKLKADPETRGIPIIIVTSLSDRASRIAGLNMGAEEFITKPIDRAELWVRVRNLLRLKELNDLLAEHARTLEIQVRERSEQLTASFRETISTLNRAAAYRDEETGAHVQRISHYCVVLAQKLGMDEAFCECIFHASPMHDIGKIAIPDHILLKPATLNAEEWQVMKTHTTAGATMLAGGDSPYLRMGREIALSHHERWDGSGYPHGLKREEISVPARLMGIADVYDALRSRRPYKGPFDHEQAIAVITVGDVRTRPEHFDPEVLAAFKSCHLQIRDIYEQLIG